MRADAQTDCSYINLPEKINQTDKESEHGRNEKHGDRQVASKCKDALRNIMAITVHTSSAVVVQSVIATLTNLARCDNTQRSARREAMILAGALSGPVRGCRRDR